MTPQEKRNQANERRKRTIIERHGSYKNMVKSRDVGDLILGGYNGGIKKNKRKGFGSKSKEELREIAQSRKRDSRGRFLPKEDR